MRNIVVMLVVVLVMVGNVYAVSDTTKDVPTPVASFPTVSFKQANTTAEAEEWVLTVKTAKGQEDYLLKQVQGFLKAKKYQEAIDVAKFSLEKVNAQSEPTKALLAQAERLLASLSKPIASVPTTVDSGTTTVEKKAGKFWGR